MKIRLLKNTAKCIFMSLLLILVFKGLPLTAHASAQDVTASLSATAVNNTVTQGQTVTITTTLNGTQHLLDFDGNGVSTFTSVMGYNGTAFTPAGAPVVGAENMLTDQEDYNANYSTGYVYYSGYSEAGRLVATSGGADNKIDMVSWNFTANTPGTYRFYLTPNYNPAQDAQDFRTYMNTYPACGEWQLQSASYVDITVTGRVEITGFAAIPNVNAGSVGAIYSTYQSSQSVRTYLLAQYPNVTANYSGGTASIAVSDWTDTDGYTTGTAGSYTFTATLNLPSVYANSGGYAATVEVVVGAGAPTLTFTGASGFWFTTYTKSGTTYNIIRYVNNTSVTATVFKNDMNINNGYVEIYNKSGTMIISTAPGSSATTSSTKVSTGSLVKLYNNSGTLINTYYPVMKGDVNGDGIFTSADTNSIRNYILNSNKYPLSTIYLYAADVNYSASKGTTGDGLMTSADTNAVRNYNLNSGKYPINQAK